MTKEEIMLLMQADPDRQLGADNRVILGANRAVRLHKDSQRTIIMSAIGVSLMTLICYYVSLKSGSIASQMICILNYLVYMSLMFYQWRRADKNIRLASSDFGTETVSVHGNRAVVRCGKETLSVKVMRELKIDRQILFVDFKVLLIPEEGV